MNNRNLVKNVNGTSRWPFPSTRESSWLEYWENRVGYKADHCGAWVFIELNTVWLVHMPKCVEATKCTSLHYVLVVIIEAVISQWTPN